MSAAIVEILKLMLSAYFSLAKVNNATEEELEQIYNDEKAKFNKNTPDKLEDV